MEKSPTNLPLQLTSFIGRERELAEVKRLLATTRLLTLTGAGGCGKTRLALQVAAGLLDEFLDGVWFVDLAPLSDPILVPQTVASIFDLRESGDMLIAETLQNYLRTKNLLLVLDNCEHLIQAGAQLSDTLLRTCPGLTILATSREALNVAGETSFRVPSLLLPDLQHLQPVENLRQLESIQLFITRAAAADPRFQLTNSNALAVAQICLRLDGMPLAIELAAARVRALSADHIAAYLDDRFRLLTTGTRTAPSRQQTLRATMDWSYDLLSEPERILFHRLSVFAGGWSLEAAEAVCSGNGIDANSILGLQSQLMDKSLVVVDERDGSTRYRMLETIRQYAYEKLQEVGEVDAVHHRHLEFFVKLAEEAEPKLFGAEQIIWFDWLETEHDNLRAAMQWAMEIGAVETGSRLAAALAYFWWERGYHIEGFERLNQFLARLQLAKATGTQAKLLNAIGFTLWTRDDQTAARPPLEKALAMARQLGDMWSVAVSLQYLARVATSQGEYTEARSYLEEGLVIWREMGARGKHGTGWSLTFLGDLTLFQGDYERAQALYKESIPLLRELADKNLLAYALRRLGLLVLHDGDHQRASELCIESLILNNELGHKQANANCLAALAAVAMAKRQMIRAVRLFGAAEALLDAITMPLIAADRIEYDRNIPKLRAQLDEATFNDARAEGHAMSMEQAVEYALKEEPAETPVQLIGAQSYPAGLTEREVEVLHLLAQGLSNQEIADKLVPSKRTVHAHLRSIYGKLDVTTRSAATRAAIENKLVSP